MSNPFPDLPAEEYDALLLDIEKRGIVYPVIHDQHGNTIDGHQREHIAAALGIKPWVKVIEVADEDERLAYAIALNVHRRHLTTQQKREAIVRLDPVKTGLAQYEIARHVGVSQSTVSNVLADARREGVITANNSPLPVTRTQAETGKTGARGGRPVGPRAERRAVVAAANRGRPSPPWFRHFSKWCNRALPEDRDLLTRMRNAIDEALTRMEAA